MHENNPVERLMGFDHGDKRIGVATAQRITNQASPQDILPATDGMPNWADVDSLISRWHPDILIIGLPLNMDESEGDRSEAAQAFGNALTKRYDIPITFSDERLSTREAKERYLDIHGKIKPGDRFDSIAACIILESWLRQHA